MAFDPINLGAAPNDASGDSLRAGGQKINENFSKALEKPASFTEGNLPVFGTGGILVDSGTKPGDFSGGGGGGPTFFMFALSDEDSPLEAGTRKISFRAPFGFTITGVRVNVREAPTGSTIVVDVNVGGASIFSTPLSIDAGETTSTTAATPAVISNGAAADDALIEVDLDQVGSTFPGSGLKATLYYEPL